jgi:glycerol-3-phosphate acyltransferase PlsX
MGGDHAPEHPVAGALTAAAEGIHVLLVGDERILRDELTRQGAPEAGVEIVHAPDAVSSGEDGARAVRAKPESSIATACRLVGEGRAGAAVSVGNTGAMLAAATLYMRRIPGVIRPAIAVVLPTTGGGSVLLLDAGASAEARAEHFPTLAGMGRLWMRDVIGVAEPRVGVLSSGEGEG